MVRCCMQGLNAEDAILPYELETNGLVIPYEQVKSHFVRILIGVRDSKTIIWEPKIRPAKTFSIMAGHAL